jgi:hypothetical protein
VQQRAWVEYPGAFGMPQKNLVPLIKGPNG